MNTRTPLAFRYQPTRTVTTHFLTPALLSRRRRPDRIGIVARIIGAIFVSALVIAFVAGLLGPDRASAAGPLPPIVHVIYHASYEQHAEPYADLLIRIAECESTFNSFARGRDGSEGLFQFQPGTWAWASVGAGFAGASSYDPIAAAYTAAWLISLPGPNGGPHHWRNCWR